MSDNNFLPVLLGGDLNAYSMARAFYEGFGAVSYVFCEERLGITDNVEFISLHVIPSLSDVNVLVPTMLGLASEHKDRELILVPCADWYMEILEFARDRLDGHFSFNIPDFDIWRIASDKCATHALFEKFGVSHPRTVSFRATDGIMSIASRLKPPYVLKPAESSLYHKYSFEGKEKVYFTDSLAESARLARKIFDTGYSGALILQERIGSAASRPIASVLTTYSDTGGKVVMAVLADAALEERAPTARGNYSALITRPLTPLCQDIINMLDRIGYRGFANFDILTYGGGEVCLEINPRQGRSCDYLRCAGINIARLLVRDMCADAITPIFEYKKILWRAVPLSVVKRYSHPSLKASVKELIGMGRCYSAYAPGGSPKRRFYNLAHAIRVRGKFRRYG
ncbi:MAG: hypothetical protein J6L90_02110 [Clostridia bacterium]|nr:hypothetical protein [Clostridia bacterium]